MAAGSRAAVGISGVSFALQSAAQSAECPNKRASDTTEQRERTESREGYMETELERCSFVCPSLVGPTTRPSCLLLQQQHAT